MLSPVAFPPGRPRFSTRPAPTGSPTMAMTMGVVRVAFLTALVAGVPPVTITSTCDPTSSAARSSRFDPILSAFPLEGDGSSLIRRDRLILARTNPGIDHIAQPALLKFVQQPAQSSEQPATLVGCWLCPLGRSPSFAASSKQSARGEEGEKSEYQRFSDAARNSRADHIFRACHGLPPGYGCDFVLQDHARRAISAL